MMTSKAMIMNIGITSMSSRPTPACIYYYYSTHRPLSSMHLEYKVHKNERGQLFNFRVLHDWKLKNMRNLQQGILYFWFNRYKNKRQSKNKASNKVMEIDMMRIDLGAIGFTSGFSQDSIYYGG